MIVDFNAPFSTELTGNIAPFRGAEKQTDLFGHERPLPKMAPRDSELDDIDADEDDDEEYDEADELDNDDDGDED